MERERIRGRLIRKGVSRGMLRLFPTEYTNDQDSTEALQQTEKLLQEDYGIMVLYNHFSKSDHIRTIARLLLDVPTVSRRPILSPVGIHQYEGPLKLLGKGTNIKLMPMVTPNTPKEYSEKIPPRDRVKMGREYISGAQETLNEGGILLLAPQAERRASLGKPLDGKPVRMILRDYDNDKVAFLFAGLEIPDQTDYSTDSIRSFNLGRKFIVKFGNLVDRKTLMALSHNDLDQVDRVVFDLLRPHVSPHYSARR